MRFERIREKLSRDDGWWLAVGANAVITISEIYDLFYIWNIFSGGAALLGTALVTIVIWSGFLVGRMLASDSERLRIVAKVFAVILLGMNSANLANWYARINQIDGVEGINREYNAQLEEWRKADGEAKREFDKASERYQKCIEDPRPRVCKGMPQVGDFPVGVPHPGPRPASQAEKRDQAREGVIRFNVALLIASVIALICLIIFEKKKMVRPIEISSEATSLPVGALKKEESSQESFRAEDSPVGDSPRAKTGESRGRERPTLPTLPAEKKEVIRESPDHSPRRESHSQEYLRTLKLIGGREAPKDEKEQKSWVVYDGLYRIVKKSTKGYDIKGNTGAIKNKYFGWFNDADGEAFVKASDADQKRMLDEKLGGRLIVRGGGE